ncbi:MAG: hypothetical protein RMJ59_05805 [Candidatus Nitrosocaldus sp.]|nr:hypothetical protein [Candidatus Nitrosocaldus sp.]MDW8275878.1 hypothetical protein [Candidatus Nitrosocaldus sp.]
MLIRHCVEESNVDENMYVVDPSRIRHVTIVAGRIAAMSGYIDPSTHLNLDYPYHRVTTCVIAERFEIGARVKFNNNGLLFASVDRSAYQHHGPVDTTQRMLDMHDAVKRMREARVSRRG